MAIFTNISLLLIGVAIIFGLAFFGLLSIREKEKRAAQVSFNGAIIGAVFFLLAASMPTSVRATLLFIIGTIGVGFIILFFLPIGKIEIGNDIPQTRFDERRIMFARANLKAGSPEYES